MSEVHGALVSATVTGGRQISVGAVADWSGGKWQPGLKNQVVRHFRAGLLLGLWQIRGVEVIRRPSSTVTWLTPLSGHPPPILEGDILILGEGEYSELRATESTLDLPGARPVRLGEQGHEALQVSGADATRLLVFHSPNASLSRDPDQPIKYRNREYRVTLERFSTSGSVLTLTLNSERVGVGGLLRLLAPLRLFVLDAGQEMLFRKERGRGRHLGETYEAFEPLLVPARGSVVLHLYPASPVQIPLFVAPQEPLLVLGRVLEAAAKGRAESMTAELSDVFSTDRLLRRIVQFAGEASELGGVQASTPSDTEGFNVGGIVAETAKAGISKLRTRTLSRQGTLYGLETEAKWCKVMTDDSDGQREDWTLRFDEEMKRKIAGRVPRELKVDFETKSAEGARSGTGKLLSFDELQRKRASS